MSNAAGVATSGGQDAPGATDNGSGPTKTVSVGDAEIGGGAGLGISGSVSFNWVSDDTEAFISDAVTVPCLIEVASRRISSQ